LSQHVHHLCSQRHWGCCVSLKMVNVFQDMLQKVNKSILAPLVILSYLRRLCVC